MKKFIILILFLTLSTQSSFAGFREHYEAGQSYFLNEQYSSAIQEFKRALRINYLDNSARIGIINSYLARGTYYANALQSWDKSANDFRSALFYLKYYPDNNSAQNSLSIINSATNNLEQCIKMSGFNTSPKSRYNKATQLRLEGNFPAAVYEFAKASEDNNLKESSYSQIGDLMKVLGNEIKAGEYYKKTLDVNPKNGPIRLKYARILDKQDKPNEALEQYNQALTLGKADPEILYALERIYLKKLSLSPNDADILANLGAIKQKQGDLDSALNYYARAEKLDTSNVTTRLNVGTLFQQKKEYEKALMAYNSILALYPDNIQANLYKAQVYSEMGDKQKAAETAKKVLKIDPNNMVAKEQLITAMTGTMNTDEVMNFIGKNYDSTSVNLLYNYAIQLHKQEKFDDAIKCYTELIKLNYNNPDLYTNLAICYTQSKNFNMAESTLKTALAKYPNNKQIKTTLQDIQANRKQETFASASDLYEKKDYEKALNLYLSVTPPTEDSLIGAAASYQALNNTAKAIEYYKKALVINPNNKEIPYYLGVLYSDLKDWQNSKTYLQKALSINPNNKDAIELSKFINAEMSATQLNTAISLFDKGNYAQSLTLLTQLLNNDKQNPYIYYYRGMTYDALNKKSEAIKDYLETLKYTNEMPIVNYLIAVDYDTLGEIDKALEYYNYFLNTYKTQDEYSKYAALRIEELKKANGN